MPTPVAIGRNIVAKLSPRSGRSKVHGNRNSVPKNLKEKLQAIYSLGCTISPAEENTVLPTGRVNVVECGMRRVDREGQYQEIKGKLSAIWNLATRN
jgi:hypothetical protein